MRSVYIQPVVHLKSVKKQKGQGLNAKKNTTRSAWESLNNS
jgi:hypothetical protein